MIGMPDVTLEIGEGSCKPSVFRSPQKDLQVDRGLQLISKVAQ